MPRRDLLNTIIVSASPRGRMFDGYVSGTPKPGTVMQMKAATEPVGGRYTWEVYNQAADGDRGLIVVLLEDQLQGSDVDKAYVTGTLGFFYCPLPGEELLMLLQDVSGTGDTRAIGDRYIVDDGTGTLIATTGTPEAEPFILCETLAAPTADGLAVCMYTGC